MSDNRAEVLAGAGVVAQDHAGRVLLIRRSDDGHWGIPGGAVNVGETWAEAAARECLEETGWIVDRAELPVRHLQRRHFLPSRRRHRVIDNTARHRRRQHLQVPKTCATWADALQITVGPVPSPAPGGQVLV